jgi:hypothetical protein
LTRENGGVFAAPFKSASVSVQAQPCGPEYDGWHVFRLNLNWRHRDGGSNGVSSDLFYNETTDELLSRDDANERYWSAKK